MPVSVIFNQAYIIFQWTARTGPRRRDMAQQVPRQRLTTRAVSMRLSPWCIQNKKEPPHGPIAEKPLRRPMRPGEPHASLFLLQSQETASKASRPAACRPPQAHSQPPAPACLQTVPLIPLPYMVTLLITPLSSTITAGLNECHTFGLASGLHYHPLKSIHSPTEESFGSWIPRQGALVL